MRRRSSRTSTTTAASDESSNAQLIPIRQLEYFKDRRKVEGDTTIADDERKKKIAEIDAKLADLGK